MKKSFNKFFKNLLLLILCLALILTGIVSLQTFLFSSVMVDGESMESTIQSSGAVAYYLINGYELDHNDIVIAYAPAAGMEQGECPSAVKNSFSTFLNNYKNYFLNIYKSINKESAATEKETENGYICVIKRVIGLPHDTICFELNSEGYVDISVNGKILEEKYIKERMKDKNSSNFVEGGVSTGTWVLGDDEYFILGDNRNHSRDSEDYGPIKAEQIMGKVWLVKQKGKLTSVKNLNKDD